MVHLKHIPQSLIHNKFSKLVRNSSGHCHCIVKPVKHRITDSWKTVSIGDGFISTMAKDSKIYIQYCLVSWKIKELTPHRLWHS